jgi:uncharacterized membrane protein
MDNNIIITILDNEHKGYEGSKALDALHAEASITLYASAVIANDDDGNVTVSQATDQGPLGTGGGLVTGSLIGLLGGPVSVPLWAEHVTFVGLLYDLAKVGVGEDFLAEVGQYLRPGKVAVVAEVCEEWVMPVDTHMEAAGGVVFRRTRAEVLDFEIERDAAAFKAEIADLKAEYARANRDTTAKLRAKISKAKASLQATQDRAKAASEAAKREMDAKINSLKNQRAKARADTRVKLEARIAAVRSEYKRRVDRLHRAWELTGEALAL